jgi:hypothetical protein
MMPYTLRLACGSSPVVGSSGKKYSGVIYQGQRQGKLLFLTAGKKHFLKRRGSRDCFPRIPAKQVYRLFHAYLVVKRSRLELYTNQFLDSLRFP